MPTHAELVDLQRTLYASRNPTRRWIHNLRLAWVTEALRRAAGTGVQRAMEVGPGSCIYLPILAGLAREVVAADIEDAYLQGAADIAAQHSNITLLRDDICQSKMPDGHFDLILCSEVVEHIPDSASAFKEMQRLLRPGGVLVLSTPQRYSTLEMTCKIAYLPVIIDVVRWIYREPVLVPGHINLMTERTVTRQVEDAGFRIEDRHKLAFYLPVVAETMGKIGQRIQQRMESALRGGPLDGLLWTQCYVARKPA